MSHNHVYQFQSKLNKARAGILDQGMINTFERRGVIIAKASGDITLDTAEEDAIEFGAEEVSKHKIAHGSIVKSLKLVYQIKLNNRILL